MLGVAIAFWRIQVALEGEKNANLLAGQRLEVVEQQKGDIQKALERVEEEKGRVKKEQENTAAALEKSRVAEKLALDTVKSVVNEIDAQLKGRPTLQGLRKKLLKTAERGLKKVARNARTAGQIDHEAIWVHIELGDIFLDLDGAAAEARKEFERAYALAVQLAEADKGNAQAQRDLSVSLSRLGNVQLQLGQTKEALASYRRSLDIRQRLAEADQGNAQAQRDLLVSHYKLGKVAEEAHSYKEAAEWYKKALDVPRRFARPEFFAKEVAILTNRRTFCEAAEKAVTDLDFALKQAPGLVPQFLDARMRVWHHKGKHAEVAATAAKLRALADRPRTIPGTNLYNAACGYALASTCADADAKTREAHAAQSVALLKEAHALGHFKPKRQVVLVKKDTDLDPLRHRADFKALLARLEKDAK